MSSKTKPVSQLSRSLCWAGLLMTGLVWGAEPQAPEVFSFGADLRLRYEALNDGITLDDRNDLGDRYFWRYRGRLWGKWAPTEDIALNGRLMWEGRHYDRPKSFDDSYNGGLMFDQLNFDWKKIGGLPLNLKAGRQDIMLGNGWLVMDGTPLDGSRTFYLDAAKFTYSLKDLATDIDLIYINQRAQTDESLGTLNGKEEDQAEQDEEGLILYARNKSLIPDSDLDGYFIYKNDDPVTGLCAPPSTRRDNNGSCFNSVSDNGEIYTLGIRLSGKFAKNWKLYAEGAGQWGQRRGNDMSGLGLNSRLTYELGDALKNAPHIGYEYLSGDDPSTRKNEAFDPLWGRWPQWSELYVYTYAIETRIGEVTNLHRLNLGWDLQPHETIKLSFDYHALWADENTRQGAVGFSDNDNFRGNLFAAWLRYKINKHVAGHLVAEYFDPGSYYQWPRDNSATFLRADLTLTW